MSFHSLLTSRANFPGALEEFPDLADGFHDAPEILMMPQLRHGQDVLITPALAECIQEQCRYEHERPLNESRLNLCINEINSGRFIPGHVISFGNLDGHLVRVNGQHRLEAVVRTGKAQSFMIAVHPVADREQLAALYASFDPASAARTPIEAGSWLLAKGDLSKRHLGVLLRAAQVIQTGCRPPKPGQAARAMQSPGARNDVANDWYADAERYFSLITAASRPVKAGLQRQAVVAVALFTVRYQPEKAAEFWEGLAMDDGLARTDPRKALSEKLRSRGVAHSVAIQMHAVATAWNAFFAGAMLKEIRVNKNKPFTLAGTPIVEVQF